VIGLVSLDTCELPITCDKTIVSSQKVSRHKIPVKSCEGIFSSEETSYILCLEYNHEVHVVVVLDKENEFQRTMDSASEYRRALKIFKSFGIIGGPSTFQINYKTALAGIGFHMENDVGVDFRKQDGNKGNKLWEYAVLKMFNRYTTELHHAYFLTEKMKTDAGGMVLSSNTAFALNSADAHLFQASKNTVSEFTNVVKARDLPTLAVGIGLLMDFQELDKKSLKVAELTDFQTKFLLEVEDRGSEDDTPNIGVYGKISKKVCENSGIKSCVAMGCPSLTLSREPSLGKLLQDKWNKALKSMKQGDKLKVVLVLPEVHGQGYIGLKSVPYIGIAKMYTNICLEHDCSFVIQDKGTDKQYFLDYDFASAAVNEDQFVVFDEDIDEWLDYMSDKDFVISTRIRGGMAGISTGVPTIMIPTDYRIQEATEEMKLPKIPIKQVIENEYSSLLSLALDTKVDFESFEKNRREKISIYKKMMNKIGFQMDPSLESILDAPTGFEFALTNTETKKSLYTGGLYLYSAIVLFATVKIIRIILN